MRSRPKTKSLDPYGNMGAVPDCQWSSEWTTWTGAETDVYIDRVLEWGQLNHDQITDLLQGIPPRPRGRDKATTCLDEALPDVERFLDDASKSFVPRSMSVREFVDWCRARGVAVPDLIRGRFTVDQERLEDVCVTAARAAYPPWAPMNPITEPNAPKRSKRGRPPGDAAVKRERLVEAATEYFTEEAKAGRFPTIQEAAQYLAGQRGKWSWKQATIVRYLKGNEKIARVRNLLEAERSHARLGQ